MNVSIFFTNKCNLKCRYCYESNKMEKSISYDLLDKTIEFIVNYKEKNKIDKISVVTHGGEPLIEFKKIKYFISNLNKRIENVDYIMTTNATLLDDNIIEYISNNYSKLSVSIDGTREAHNLNRIFKNDSGSYDYVIGKARKLLDKRSDLKARLTINPKNVEFLFEGVKELIEFGFIDIEPVPDEFDNTWNEDSLNTLYLEGKKIIDYFSKNDLLVNIALINDALVKCKNNICDGGITTMSIESNGDIYPCIASVGHKEFIIGNISNKIQRDKLEDIRKWGTKKNTECTGCKRYDYCTATRCKIINKLLTNNLHRPSAVTCNLQNVRVNLSEYYKKEIF
ncbi:MAG: radical SAM protein [Clostridium butyricum]|uniref:radical SAM protein n=1 Tax=Clostridium butyricum TaxID=1492 RepID=UPI002909E573|nr:radical SAM protein [Clostridium butyricum]MDU5820436.1 radical SAM protein [Clostridium butyricum]